MVYTRGKKIIFIMVMITISILLIPYMVYAREYNNIQGRKVKVGWYSIPGDMDKDSNGKRTGYSYEYLKALSKYTGFKYEYVECSWGECIEKLKNGEIDILTGLNFSEERAKYMNFSELSMGYSNVILATKEDNDKISRGNYSTYNGNKVGVIAGGYDVELVKKFFKRRNVDFHVKGFKSYDDLNNAIEHGDVDIVAVGSSDILKFKYKLIEQFSSQPMYIAVNKNKQDLLNEINYGVQCIYEYDKEYSNTIYSRKKSDVWNNNINLTYKEKQYLKGIDTLNFVGVNNSGYFSYKIDDKVLGINQQLAAEIASRLDKPYKYSTVNGDYLNVRDKLNDNDILCGGYFDYYYAEQENIRITSPYFETQFYEVSTKNKSSPMSNNRKIAVTDCLYPRDFINESYIPSQVMFFDNEEQCLEAVKSGQCDVAYVNSVAADYYLQQSNMSRLSAKLIPYKCNITFVTNDHSYIMTSIISKVMATFQENEIQRIVIKNTTYSEPQNLLTDYIYDNPIKVSIFVSTIFMIVLCLVLVLIYNRKLKKKNIKIQEILDIASRDSMTTLYNRATFEELVTNWLNLKEGNSAFIILDIDDFKHINDTYGHFIGDEVITNVAEKIRNHFRANDYVGRMGGDEFAIFIRNIRDDGYIVLEKRVQGMMMDINNCMMARGYDFKVGVSIGVHRIQKNQCNFEQVYKKADEALYESKKGGKNIQSYK